MLDVRRAAMIGLEQRAFRLGDTDFRRHRGTNCRSRLRSFSFIARKDHRHAASRFVCTPTPDGAAARAGRAEACHRRRRHCRVPSAERPASAAGARRFKTDDDCQPDLSRRQPAGELRRNGHGPSARTPAVQRLAAPPDRVGRIQQARLARQRQHLARPHQLFRQLLGQRRQPGLDHRLARRRDGQQLLHARISTAR